MANRVLLISTSQFESRAITSYLTFQGYAVITETNDLKRAKLIMSTAKIDILISELIDQSYIDFAKSARGINSHLGVVFFAPIRDLRLFDLKLSNLPNGSQIICKSNIAHFALITEAIENSLKSDARTNWVNPPEHEITDELTDLQVETLRMVVAGYTNREIGKNRYVSEKAVEQIIARLGNVLGITFSTGQNLRVKLTAQFMNWTNGRK